MRNNSTFAGSVPSRIAWPPEAWNVSLTVLTFLGAAALNIVPGVVYLAIAVALHAVDPRHPKSIPLAQLLVAQLVTFVPLGAYLAIVLPRVARRSLRALGVRAPTATEVGFGIAGTLFMFLAVTIAGSIISHATHRTDTETAVALLEQSKSVAEKLMFFAIACVIAPMIEELEFRVFVFNALTRYVSVPVAALASALVFGFVHAAAVPQLLTVSIPLACGGIVLAYVYARTRNYWSGVITHGLFNSISVVAVFFFHAK